MTREFFRRKGATALADPAGMTHERYGLTACEQAVMDLHDAGMNPVSIAQSVGVTVRYVRQIGSRYNGRWVENIAFDDMVRAGSAALLAAIDRTGQRFA